MDQNLAFQGKPELEGSEVWRDWDDWEGTGTAGTLKISMWLGSGWQFFPVAGTGKLEGLCGDGDWSWRDWKVGGTVRLSGAGFGEVGKN
jgi:hypothetical protein